LEIPEGGVEGRIPVQGVNVPDISDIDVSDSPFHSGALGRFLETEEIDSDRFVILTFLHFFFITILKLFITLKS
jgi:hypothetical protein